MVSQDRDALTGLGTNELFQQTLAQLIEVDHADQPISIGMFDVDMFLKLNQSSGRESGDLVLTELAKLFSSTLDDGGETFRIGGDEFAVMLPGTEKEAAFLKLEQVRAAFESLDTLAAIDPPPSISIGVATYPDDGPTRQEVLRKADDALFRAKNAGRNRVALAREEKKVPKTSHYTQGQLDRLSAIAGKQGVGEAELLREALDDLLKKYSS